MTQIILALLALAAVAGTVMAETRQNADAASLQASQLTNRGAVLEVIDSSMYTYLQVSSDTGAVWLAAYRNDISRGDTVSYSRGVMMTNFFSKSLNRTFDKIIFVDAVAPVKN